MLNPRKIVVFTGSLAYSVRKGIVAIDRALPGLSWLVVIHSPRKTPSQLIKSQLRNTRLNGLRWIPYQAGDLWQRLTARGTPDPTPDSPGAGYSLSAMKAQPNMRFEYVRDLHAPTSLETIRRFGPDLGLSIAAPILREGLFSIPREGTLNLHKGRLPHYRGMPPAFWELWNDEQSVGCTVHWVDAKLDTGDIVRQSIVSRAPFSTLRGLQLQLDEVGIDLMRAAVEDVFAGKAERMPQTGAGKTYRKPTLPQVAALARKLSAIEPPGPAAPVRALKGLRTAARFGFGQTVVRPLSKPRITVLLYHRVTDDVRDNLTVGIEQFDRQMALIRKYCEPMSIQDVLRCEVVPRSTRPLVAITFDDGYRDNHDNAAPILMRHGIPAAFFVSTGIVTNQGRFPHDLRRGNPEIPVMTWDQLRHMRDLGFTIGSHSVNHIDCASESAETVREELARSRQDLQRELGLSEVLFAYPYGGKRHMTPERLEFVKQAGYVACLAAYGGANVGTVDRFNVLRRGISYGFSERAFRFECLGLT